MGNVVQKPKQSIKDFKRKHSTFTCQICYELRKKKFKHSKWKSHRICLECMEQYISTQVHNSCSKIRCPHPKCNKIMDPVLHRSMISSHLFQNWFDLLCKETIMRLERVYCPFSDCSVPILNECWDNAGKTKCPNCSREFCYKCQVPWNVCGKRCDEGETCNDKNDDLFRQLAIAQNWIRCPSCYSVIERVSGCPKVKCRCGVYFCYTCGKKMADHRKGSCPTS
ncbi:RBR-type E3 ubiquitin transferase [Ranunculus cassubicifolius]